MTTTNSAVGFIGAGSMGGPMIERLLAGGVPVHLFARRPEVGRTYAALGATIESSVAAVAAATDVIVLCPFSQQQLDEILLGDEGLLSACRPGSVLVQHATVSADHVATLAVEAATHDVVLLDAPISGTSDAIRAGELTVLLGGPSTAIDRVTPALATYAATILSTGEPGTASTTKLINNLVFAAHVQIAGAALELGAELGIDETALLEAITSCSANSFAFTTLRGVGSAEVFAEYAAPYLRKDVAVIEQEVTRSGLDTGLLGVVVRDGRFDLS